jgi:hypothetical protein
MGLFHKTAQNINTAFSVIPVLHGSLGLQRLVDDNLSPDDIDVGVPLFMLSEKWADLVKLMENGGYEMIDLHEKCFRYSDDISMSFCAIEGTNEHSTIPGLCDFAGIDLVECPIIEENGAVYRIPTLHQYLAIYKSSQDDEYRKDKTNDKDKRKIDTIHRALNIAKEEAAW